MKRCLEMKRCLGLVAAVLFLLSPLACATYHTFQIEQLYSNADGTVQFIILHEVSGLNDQNLLTGHTLRVTRSGVATTYTFPNDLPTDMEMGDGGYGMMYGYGGTSPTALSRVLIATQGFAKLGLIDPDYVIPNGFLPIAGGTLDYAGVSQWTYGPLPTDGANALYSSGAKTLNKAQNFAGMTASVTQPASVPAVLNFQGLWYNAPAESESGWGINLAHQGDLIFATWFTYDLNGKPWWLTLQAQKTSDNVYSGPLLETHGPAFNAVPFDPHGVTHNIVGTGQLTFTDVKNGSFDYTVNGVHQTKTIVRQEFGAVPTCVWGAQANLALATNYQDIWWASPAESESGWGVNFTHQGDKIFATWFTYNLDGTPLWLSALADKTAPGVYDGPWVRTTGPAFNAVPFDPKAVTRDDKAGTLTITFANGNSGMFMYTVDLPGQPSVTQTKPITRQVFTAPGTVCQ